MSAAGSRAGSGAGSGAAAVGMLAVAIVKGRGRQILTPAQAAPDQEWVSCDRCSKWRKLPPGTEVSGLPEKWYCEFNSNAQLALCSVPEEDDDDRGEGSAAMAGAAAGVAAEVAAGVTVGAAADVAAGATAGAAAGATVGTTAGATAGAQLLGRWPGRQAGRGVLMGVRHYLTTPTQHRDLVLTGSAPHKPPPEV